MHFVRGRLSKDRDDGGILITAVESIEYIAPYSGCSSESESLQNLGYCCLVAGGKLRDSTCMRRVVSSAPLRKEVL
jgi:hypothetical protein